MVTSKVFWKSAELQFYALMGILPDILDVLAQNLPTLQTLIPDTNYKIMYFIALAGGAILRTLKTKTAVTLK